MLIMMAAWHLAILPLHGDNTVECDCYIAQWTVLRGIKINRLEGPVETGEKGNNLNKPLNDRATFEASFVQVNLTIDPVNLADDVSNWLMENANVADSKRSNIFLPASDDRWRIIRHSSATELTYFIIRIVPNLPSHNYIIEFVKAHHCGGGMYQKKDDESIIRREVDEFFVKKLTRTS